MQFSDQNQGNYPQNSAGNAPNQGALQRNVTPQFNQMGTNNSVFPSRNPGNVAPQPQAENNNNSTIRRSVTSNFGQKRSLTNNNLNRSVTTNPGGVQVLNQQQISGIEEKNIGNSNKNEENRPNQVFVGYLANNLSNDIPLIRPYFQNHRKTCKQLASYKHIHLSHVCSFCDAMTDLSV